MLSPTAQTIRLFLHVLSASVWVGGQIVLAGLVPSLKANYPGSTKVAAKAFARIAWPAYTVLIVTGLWNLTEVDVTSTTSTYQVTIFVKITLAIVAGAATAIHQFGQTKLALALGGAIGMLASLGAMFVGYLLTTGA